MAAIEGQRLVAVYEDEARARAAVHAATDVGTPATDVRLGDQRDRLASIAGEMRDETVHVGGPFTEEMGEGSILGIAVAGLIGLVVALPFAAIGMGGLELWARLLIVAIVGAAVGGVVGWIVGGAFAAKRPDEPLAAEAGVTVATPLTEQLREVLLATDPVRLDVVASDGQPITTLAHRPHGALPTIEDIGRHFADEERRD